MGRKNHREIWHTKSWPRLIGHACRGLPGGRLAYQSHRNYRGILGGGTPSAVGARYVLGVRGAPPGIPVVWSRSGGVGRGGAGLGRGWGWGVCHSLCSRMHAICRAIHSPPNQPLNTGTRYWCLLLDIDTKITHLATGKSSVGVYANWLWKSPGILGLVVHWNGSYLCI